MSETFLHVEYREKDEVKRLGARWNGTQWYVPAGRDLTPFARWLPDSALAAASSLDNAPTLPVQGLSLREVMQQIGDCVRRGLPELLWIRAELTKVDCRPGRVFLDLVERDENGEVASVKAVIWQPDPILAQFRQHTSQDLAAGMQALVQARVEVQDRIGLRLVIKAIDPTYTVGVMAHQLKVIRQTLQQEGIINRNRQLALPTDFFRVAVISPEGAAGLGDFQAGAAPLEQYGICQFHYFTALFQGPKTKESLLQALQKASALPDIQALVMIRGGGTVADLHWLNELELARAICRSPIPVIIGIGHQRDQTILDEVANCSKETPSMVIAWIRETIRHRADRTRSDFNTIQSSVERRLKDADQSVENHYQTLTHAAHSRLQRLQPQIETDHDKVISQSRNHLAIAQERITTQHQQVRDHTRRVLEMAEKDLAYTWLILGERTHTQINGAEQALMTTHGGLIASVKRQVDSQENQFTEQYRIAIEGCRSQMNQAEKGLKALWEQFKVSAWRRTDHATENAERLFREIVGQGPEKTLRRGFALVRDAQGEPITSQATARQQARLTLSFHDGSLSVKRDINDE